MADVQTDDQYLQPLHAFAGTDTTPESKSEDDQYLQPLRAFAAPASPDITPPADARWSDVPHGIAAGAHRDLFAPLAQITSSTAFTPELQQQYGDIATQQRQAGRESEAAMSPGGQQEAKTGSGIVGLAEQAAPTAAFALPAMIPGVGPALGLGAGAILGAGGAESQVQGAIEQDPKYASMTPDEKRQFGEKVIADTGTGWKSAVIQGTLGAAGGVELGGVLSKLGLGAAEKAALTGTGRVQGAGTAIGRGFVEMGTTGAAQTGVTQHALAQAGEGDEPTIGDVAKAGMEQGLLGAVIGGPLGFLHGGAHKTPSVKAPNTEAVGGENVAVGGGVDVNKDSKRGSTVQAPPATKSPVTPDIAAATDADKDLHPPPTPGVNQSTEPTGELNQGATGTPPGQEVQTPPPATQPPPAVSPAPPEGAPSVPNRIGLTAEPGSAPTDLAPVRSPSVPDMSAGRNAPTGLFEGPAPVLRKGIPGTEGVEEPRGPLIAGRDYGMGGQGSFGDRFKAAVAEARAKQAPDTPVTEHPETLRLQEEAFLNGNKEIIHYPRSEGINDKGAIADLIKSGKADVLVNNGDTTLYRTDGPNNLNYGAVYKALKNPDEMARLLGYGISKDEAVARTQPPFNEKPVAVVEQTPAGREARSAAGTDATAAAQAQAMEATKLSPENNIVLKSPEEVIAARPPEQAVAGAEATSGVKRVLQDVSEEGKATHEAFNKGVQERAAQVVERVQEAGHRDDTKKQARLDNNAVANRVFDKLSVGKPTDGLALDPEHGGKGARQALLARLKNAIGEAEKGGWEVPGSFRKNVDPEMNHSLGSVWLKEASTLVNRARAGKSGTKDFARFLKREEMARKGDMEGILNDRINEAKEVKEPKAEVKEEAVGEATPGVTSHVVAEHAETDEEAAYQRARDAKEADRMAKLRAESAEIRRIYPAAEAQKEAPKFVQEVKKSRAVRRQEIEEGEPSTAREALYEYSDLKRYGDLKGMVGKLRDTITRIAGHIPVHFISHEEMLEKTGGIPSHGMYDVDAKHIYINRDNFRPDTVLHETFHAATTEALEQNPELAAQMGRLHEEAKAAGLTNAKDPEEFLTHLMTDANVQAKMKGFKISDELARDIGIPKWRKQTMWEGALSVIRQALNMGPRDTSAIEAAMAISEHAITARSPDIQMEAAGRMARSQMRLQQIEPAAEKAQEATRKTPEFWKSTVDQYKRSGVEETGYKLYTKGANTDTLRINSEHLFGKRTEQNSMRIVQEGMERQGQLINKMLSEHDPLVQRVADMKRANPDGLNRMITLLSESSDFNVHPDEELGTGLNDHITADKYDKATKSRVPLEPHEFSMEHQESALAHPRLSDEYNRSTKEEQGLFRDLRDALMVEGRKRADAHYKSFTDALKYNFEKDEKLQEALGKSTDDRSPAEEKKIERYNVISKILNGDKLDDNEKEKFGNDTHVVALRELKSMQKQEGPYYPGGRKGEWVIRGTHELPEAPKAVSVEGNQVTFNSREDATEYRQKLVDQSLPSTLHRVQEELHTESTVASQQEQYRVTVQNKHMSTTDSTYEGNKLADTLRQQGLTNVTEPMLKSQNKEIDYGLHSGTMKALENSVNALTHLTDEQKADLHEANEQAAMAMMKGNRVNQGLMKSNRVRGANADPVLALHDYFSASARSRAQAQTMPEINRAFDQMRDTARNVQDKDTWKRGMLVNEMEQRALNFGKDGFTGQMSPTLQNLSTLAYLKYMMAPIHYALDLTHPYLISIPQLAERHGFFNSQVAFQKALNDMGGRTPVLAKGLVGAWKAAWEKGHTATDFTGNLLNTLKSNGATADEVRAVQQAIETGHLHSILMDFRPHFDKTGVGSQVMRRAQSVGQDMSSAVDAINRVATYLAGYRLERGKMGEATTLGQQQAHHAQAIRYAKDTLSQTQGLYTAANRASFMKNPAVRAAMQFRSVPMMIYKVMAKNIYTAFKGETKEVRWAAVRSLVATMGTTAALAGVGAGVPEPIRLAVMLTHMFGLTGSWQDLEDKARKSAESNLGKFGGHLVMDGILGAAGLSAGSRIGLNDLLVKGDPTSGSVKDFLFDTLVGAGGGYLNDEIGGVNKILHGDLQHGIPAAIPVRLFSDISKAYMENQEGKPAHGAMPAMKPLDPFETFVRAMGGTPTREANYNKMTSMMHEESTNKANVVKSGSVQEVLKWNAAHPLDRISPSQLHHAKQQAKKITPRVRELEATYGQ